LFLLFLLFFGAGTSTKPQASKLS